MMFHLSGLFIYILLSLSFQYFLVTSHKEIQDDPLGENMLNNDPRKLLEDLFSVDGQTSEHLAIKEEMIELILRTSRTCQTSIDTAGHKMDILLEYIEDEPRQDDDTENSFVNETDILHHKLFGDQLFDGEFLKQKEFHTANSKPIYLSDLEDMLVSIKEACSALPESLPKLHHRKTRSAEKIVKKFAISLKKWAEKWLSSIESRIDKFMVDCFEDSYCKDYFEKVLKHLVHTLKAGTHSFEKTSSKVLEDLLKELHYPRNPSLEFIDYLQAMFHGNENYMDSFRKQEEGAFNLAENFKNVPAFSKNIINETQIKSDAEVYIESNEVITRVPKTFLSLAFGSSLIHHNWGQIKNKLSRFVKTASALSPSMIRVGGSAANFLTYKPMSSSKEAKSDYYWTYQSTHPKLKKEMYTSPQLNKNNNERVSSDSFSIDMKQSHLGFDVFDDRCDPQHSTYLEYQKDYRNFTMTGEDWKFLVDLVCDLEWTLLFDLNQFWRDSEGNWDPTNARLILEDKQTGRIPVIWQLGNEPNAYHHKFGWTVTPEQVARDYKRLKQILEEKSSFFDRNYDLSLVGPDVTRPKHMSLKGESKFSEDSMEFLERFLDNGNDLIDALTWHQYYMNGRTATVDNFLSPEILDAFPRELQKIVSIRNMKADKIPIWITETASAWGGGAPGLSNRYAACFAWLDKLGASALGGAQIVFRQTLYGGCYALLDPFLNPYPDYWVSVIHKQVVGEGVLLLRARLVPHSIRVYAHCLKSNHPEFKKGAVVIFGMNLSNKKEIVHLKNEEMTNSTRYLYEITSPNDNLKSRNILLNGQVLRLNSDGTVPPLIPVQVQQKGLVFTTYAISFWIFPEADARACY